MEKLILYVINSIRQNIYNIKNLTLQDFGDMKTLKDLLDESSAINRIYKMVGVLSYKDRNISDILSDMRAIKGVTIISETPVPLTSTSLKKVVLNIKIDPYPFQTSEDGFDKVKVDEYIIEQANKIPGVVAFKSEKGIRII